MLNPREKIANQSQANFKILLQLTRDQDHIQFFKVVPERVHKLITKKKIHHFSMLPLIQILMDRNLNLWPMDHI